MEAKKNKPRIFKEEGKNSQVTHWGLDYLPSDEVSDLYK